jgi:hypothetical protein
MKKVTLSAIVLIVVVCVVSAVAVVLINHIRLLAAFEAQDRLCYDFGLELSTYMGDNQTMAVAGCECHFLPIAYMETVTECVCECMVPGIPVGSCESVQGCFVRDLECYCSFGIFLQ